MLRTRLSSGDLARSPPPLIRFLLLATALLFKFSMAVPTTTVSSSSTTTTGATSKSFLPMPFTTIKEPLPSRDSIYLWSSLFAGVGSGALASIICAPLDVVRTQIQVYGEVVSAAAAVKGSSAAATRRSSIGMIQVLRNIIRTEGAKGCFRGLGATLITVPAFWGVYFPLYDEIKRRCRHYYPEMHPSLVHCGSAVLAGGVSDLICNPMFVVRTRLQTESLHNLIEGGSQHKISSLGMIRTAQALYREGGALAFWRGLTASLTGLSHVAIQFPAYEMLKARARANKQAESALDLLLASFLSKTTASLITYPHEVVRSRMMDSRSGSTLFQMASRIYEREGWLGFYSGLHISLIRVIPNCCITFMTYELLLRFARDKIDRDLAQR